MKKSLLMDVIEGKNLSFAQKNKLIIQLSLPTIFAQISTIIMEYIDASMVGRLGANDSASIGLVSSTIWLLTGLSSSFNAGFTVLMTHCIGANEKKEARNIMKQGFLVCLTLSVIVSIVSIVLSPILPVWLKGNVEIIKNASNYLKIYSFFIPFHCMNVMASFCLQASGNMKIPSIFNILMCLLNVILNYYFVFPAGLNMGVKGASLATGLSIVFCMICLLFFIFYKSEILSFQKKERISWDLITIKRAFQIGFPVTIESALTSLSYIVFTRIVAPLGTLSIAANSFAITAESLCYMPAYGIANAATTIIGQTLGARREDMTISFAYIITFFTVIMMSFSGCLLYFFSQEMIQVLTPDIEVQNIAVSILKIEAFAEPLYGASIVCAGIFRGAKDTLSSTRFNFISMWLVRLPLAYIMSLQYGLKGAWISMCLELYFRGSLFLFRLFRKTWLSYGLIIKIN